MLTSFCSSFFKTKWSFVSSWSDWKAIDLTLQCHLFFFPCCFYRLYQTIYTFFFFLPKESFAFSSPFNVAASHSDVMLQLANSNCVEVTQQWSNFLIWKVLKWQTSSGRNLLVYSLRSPGLGLRPLFLSNFTFFGCKTAARFSLSKHPKHLVIM